MITQELLDSAKEDIKQAIIDMGLMAGDAEQFPVSWIQFSTSVADDPYSEGQTKTFLDGVDVNAVVVETPNAEVMDQLGWREEVDMLVFLSKKDVDERRVTITGDDRFVYDTVTYEVKKLMPVKIGPGSVVAYVVGGKQYHAQGT